MKHLRALAVVLTLLTHANANSNTCIDATTHTGSPEAVRILGMLARSFQHYPGYKFLFDDARDKGVVIHSFCMSFGALAAIHQGAVYVNIGMDEFMETSPGMSLAGTGRALREEAMLTLGIGPAPHFGKRANTMISVALHADSWAQTITAAAEMSLYFQRERAFYELNKPGVLFARQRITDITGPLAQYKTAGAQSMQPEAANRLLLKLFTRFFSDKALVHYIASQMTENGPDDSPFDPATTLQPLGRYLNSFPFDELFPIKSESSFPSGSLSR